MNDKNNVNDCEDDDCALKPLRIEALRPKPKLEAAANQRFKKILTDHWETIAIKSTQTKVVKGR
jgi:hypothetical protein